MVLMRYGIVQPILSTMGLHLELPVIFFLGLIISVVLIAASGYIINDYFDLQADTVNRPFQVVIGKYITPGIAYKLYFVFNCVALILSFYISYQIGSLALFIIFPVTIGFLYFYSTTYKRQVLVGNVLVSLLTACVPMLVALYDIIPLIKSNREYLMTYNLGINIIFIWVGAFALFAFLVNVVRELVKDAEDYEGDLLYGKNTLPIIWGSVVTKITIISFISLIIIGLGWIYCKYLCFIYIYDKVGSDSFYTKIDFITLLYFLVLIFVPLGYIIYLVSIARERKQYHLASRLLKLVMVAGVMFALVVRIKVLN